MSYKTILLRTITLVCVIVCFAAPTPKADTQTSPLSAEKVQAKQDAVAAHAAKKRACNTQAKEQSLHLKKRRAFMRACKAAK